MLKCKLCKKQTNEREPTGTFRTMVYIDPKDKSKGKRIFKSIKVCMNCDGECLLKWTLKKDCLRNLLKQALKEDL